MSEQKIEDIHCKCNICKDNIIIQKYKEEGGNKSILLYTCIYCTKIAQHYSNVNCDETNKQPIL